MFDRFLQLGVEIIRFFGDSGSQVVDTFTKPISELDLMLGDSFNEIWSAFVSAFNIGNASLVSIMFSVGIPLFIAFTLAKWITDVIIPL